MSDEREELRTRLSEWTDAPLTILALVMLALLAIELAAELPPAWAARVEQTQVAIWILFAAVFVVEFALAPAKLRYLRTNWLTAVSVILPAFRAVRVLRVTRVLRGVRLVRVMTTFNRGTHALQQIASTARYAYVALLTASVSALGAAAVLYFERDVAGSGLRTFGDALWWSLTTLTTINSGAEPVSFEGRVIGILVRLFGLGLSGYLTATIAVYLLGARSERSEIEALRADIQALSRGIAAKE